MAEKITQDELNSLINLLDDPDSMVFQNVVARLRNAGNEIVPILKKHLITEKNSLRKNRLKSIIKEIDFNILIDIYTQCCKKKHFNILEFLVVVANYKYPSLKLIEIKQDIHKIILQVKQETNIYSTPLQRIKMLNHVLFSVHKFSANYTKPMAPDNSFINIVLKEKKGSDIMLGILYTYIADQLGMPVYGVDFPKNFLLAYVDISKKEKNLETDISFYINPFNQGIVLTKTDIDVFLKQNKMPVKHSYYVPANQFTIAVRLLRYLIISYKRNSKPEEANKIKRLLEILRQYKGNVA